MDITVTALKRVIDMTASKGNTGSGRQVTLEELIRILELEEQDSDTEESS